jgi:hypothetical protein
MKDATRWSEREGREVVEQWRRSGLAMAAFARGRGIGTARLRYWRDRVDEGNGDSEAPALVPGIVVGFSGGVAGRLPNGVVVQVHDVDAVSARWVADLVHAIEPSE